MDSYWIPYSSWSSRQNPSYSHYRLCIYMRSVIARMWGRWLWLNKLQWAFLRSIASIYCPILNAQIILSSLELPEEYQRAQMSSWTHNFSFKQFIKNLKTVTLKKFNILCHTKRLIHRNQKKKKKNQSQNYRKHANTNNFAITNIVIHLCCA